MSTEANRQTVKPRAHMVWCGHKVLGADARPDKRVCVGVLVYAIPRPGMGWQQCDPAELSGAPDYYNGRTEKIGPNGELLPPRFLRPIYWMVNPELMQVTTQKIDKEIGIVMQIYRTDTVSEDQQMMQACKMAYTLARTCGYPRFAIALKSAKTDPMGKPSKDKGPDFPPAMTEEDSAALDAAVRQLGRGAPDIVVADAQDEAKMVKQAEATRPELKIVR